jgi:hypothetical protein
MYEFYIAAVTTNHKFSGLNQHKFLILLFCTLRKQVCNQLT